MTIPGVDMKISALKQLPRSALLAAMLAFSGEAAAAFKVVGYFPTWQGDVNTIPYSKVTHINYSFVLPTSTGGLMPLDGGGARLQTLVSKAHASGVKVLIAVGGWNNGDDSAFRNLSASSTYRTAFVNNIINFVNQYNLDGVDIDWEYPDAGTEANNFVKLMQQLSTALKSRGKLLTAAVTANDWPGSVNAEVINTVDFLNLMVYDMGTPHSTYQHAQNALAHWKYDEGLPKSKAVLGVPFYSHTNWVAYKDIIARYGSSAAQVDNAGGLDYNGQPTIRAKAELAKAEAGGVMFWELSQDTTNGTSLLSTISEVVGSTNSGGGTTAERFAIPGTVEAERYQGFYDTTPGNSGNTYRTDSVDIEVSTQNAYNVGWIAAGEWLDYPVNIASAGQFKVEALVASQSSGGRFRLMVDGQSLGQITVPVTGAWQNWQWVSTQITLPAGQKTLRVSMDTAGFNLNALRFTQVTTGGGGTSTPIAAGRYTIKAVHSGKCIDVAAASTQDGANVQQYSCNNTGAQAFDLRFDNAGNYQIINANSKKHLDIVSAGTANGANVQQWSANGADNQKYTIVDRGSGQFEIRAKHSGKCLDIAGVSASDSANLQQWTCNSQSNQRFMFAHSNWSAGGGTTPPPTTTTWKKANLTNYTSYPDPGSEECIKYNGCEWAGYFAFVNGKQSESWVKNNNIIAVHSKDANAYKLKTLRLRQGSKTIDAIVYDMCSDSDCNGCCTENARETGFLIDVEKYTMQRFGSGDGIVEWTCLDCN